MLSWLLIILGVLRGPFCEAAASILTARLQALSPQ
jgi:hypothetical protein